MTNGTWLEWATARVRDWGKRMVSILDPLSVPVGVRFVAADQLALERATVLKQYQHCQALAKAGRGEHLLLSTGEVACRAAATLFGFCLAPAQSPPGGDRPERFALALDVPAGCGMLEGMPWL